MKIMLVCGARPNFMKVAAIYAAAQECQAPLTFSLVHTGQHYDANMSDVFFSQLGLPQPDYHLNVGSGSHALQTAEIMRRFEPVLLEQGPDWLVVVGDVNSTMACALVAAKLGVRVAHVEAGLRSFDRRMPEEINRVVTDAISDLLLVSEPSGLDHLRREGVPADRLHFVGNVMVDTLLRCRPRAQRPAFCDEQQLRSKQYVTLTLHRPSNVDDLDNLRRLVDVLLEISREIPLVFPVHPRTLGKLDAAGLLTRLQAEPRCILIPPAGYLEFLYLMDHSRLIVTDSGGIQEESTVLGVPCLTLRENTERPITLEQGTSILVGTDPAKLLGAVQTILTSRPRASKVPEKWDGFAGQRIVEILASRF